MSPQFAGQSKPDDPHPFWEGTAPAETCAGDGEQSRDFVYVDNVVEANMKAATIPAAAGGTFNVGTGRSVSILAVLEHLQRALGTSILPKIEPARIGDVRDSLADISQAEQVLGYSPRVNLEEGVTRTAAFYQAEHR